MFCSCIGKHRPRNHTKRKLYLAAGRVAFRVKEFNKRSKQSEIKIVPLNERKRVSKTKK